MFLSGSRLVRKRGYRLLLIAILLLVLIVGCFAFNRPAPLRADFIGPDSPPAASLAEWIGPGQPSDLIGPGAALAPAASLAEWVGGSEPTPAASLADSIGPEHPSDMIGPI